MIDLDKDIECDLSWVDTLKKCPYCKNEVDIDIRQENPEVATIKCECGYKSIALPPYDIRPLKGVLKEVRF